MSGTTPGTAHGSVTPYLVIQGASAAIDYYKKVFGATERMRMDAPGGMIGHAELAIGDSTIMLADEFPGMGFRGPKAFGGSPVSLTLYVPNVDEGSQAGDPVPRCSSEPISARSASVRPFANRWMRGITSVVSKYACAQPAWTKPEGMKRPSS